MANTCPCPCTECQSVLRKAPNLLSAPPSIASGSHGHVTSGQTALSHPLLAVHSSVPTLAVRPLKLNGTLGWLPLTLVPGSLPGMLQVTANPGMAMSAAPPAFTHRTWPDPPPNLNGPAMVRPGVTQSPPSIKTPETPVMAKEETLPEAPVKAVQSNAGPCALASAPTTKLSASDLRVPVATYRTARPTATEEVRQALARSAEQVFRPDNTDGLPWKCPFAGCSKAYRNAQALEVHYRKHTDHAFVCAECDKTFARRRNFVEHLRVHTGERPFRCNMCPKAFKQPHSLTDHIRTHTGDKPFVCDLCGRAFAVKHNMKTHRELHLGRKEFKCEYCGKVLHTKHGYRGHVASFHLGVQ